MCVCVTGAEPASCWSCWSLRALPGCCPGWPLAGLAGGCDESQPLTCSAFPEAQSWGWEWGDTPPGRGQPLSFSEPGLNGLMGRRGSHAEALYCVRLRPSVCPSLFLNRSVCPSSIHHPIMCIFPCGCDLLFSQIHQIRETTERWPIRRPQAALR